MNRHRRGTGFAVAGALLVLGPIIAAVDPAAGEGRFPGTFAATAGADGVRVTLVQPGVTLTKTLVDLGGPSAHATLNSLGESRAFASFPYPGDTVAGAHGLLRGAGNIPAPAYPLYVSSDNPAVPSQEAGDGPYALRAESTEAASNALATVGLRIEGLGDLGLSRSEASTVSASDGVTAHSRTETSAFSLGPLRIGRVLSVADAVLGQDGLLTRKAETVVVGAMVGTAPVEVTAGGISVAGAAGPPADLAAVNEALKGAGITVELLPKGETATGVTSPALRVTSEDKSGSAITYVLGRASASVEGTADTPVVDGSTSVTGPTPDADGGAEAVGPSPAYAEATPPEEGSASTDLRTTTNEAASDRGSLIFDVPVRSGEGGTSSAGTAPVDGDRAPAGSSESVAGSRSGPSGGRGPTTAPVSAPQGSDSRVAILATRALLNGGDTRPLYAAALTGIALCLGLAGFMRRLGRAARSGER